ncbi:MAG: AAA family ATPase [Deltaproteobacteria bacterium]|jgi:hypothetical protein|nr:AAA family ATPase [Deltaproteobacteria bacterium]
MNEQQEKYFSELTKNAEESANALNSFRLQGVIKSVIDKYSDQAHFIYELLQNAEDAKATSARFKLFDDKLVFAHNGTRRFSVSNPLTESEDIMRGALGDINAISAVGASNKSDATIGKFGVGFKAVFQYTSTPYIYDPDVFFKLERFIVPIRVNEDFPDRLDDETLFVFPFNHDKLSPEESFEDILDKLHSLNYPILFLTNLKNIKYEISSDKLRSSNCPFPFFSNLKNIKYEISDVYYGFYLKEIVESRYFGDTTANLITLSNNNIKNHDIIDNNSLWLFTRSDDNQNKFSVGFFFNNDGKLTPKKNCAFSFFPTKEVTGLNFIINAPFLLTDSRENIKARDRHNLHMISSLSNLTADSFVYLRDIGLSQSKPLIDDNIIDILPYDDSIFGDIESKDAISFKPFFKAIKESFENHQIIPSFDNSYVTSSDAYWGGSENLLITKMFSNAQLASLTGNANAKWGFPSLNTYKSGINSKIFEYINSIIKNYVTENTLIDLINESFIEAQDFSWLHSFYKFISDNADRTKRVKTKPIFLDSEGKAAKAFDAKGQPVLFLPSGGDGGFRTIHDSLLQDSCTLDFLRRFGLNEPSLRDQIYNNILPLYDGNSEYIDIKPHFKKFFNYYLSCSDKEAISFINLLKGYKFILCHRQNIDKQYLSDPINKYLPLGHLLSWFSAKPDTQFVCFDEYLQLLGDDKREDLIKFFIDLGVNDSPQFLSREIDHDLAAIITFQKSPSSKKKNNTEKWTERYLDGCHEIIEQIISTEKNQKAQRTELSFMVWNQLLAIIKSIGSSSSLKSELVMNSTYVVRNKSKADTFDSRDSKRLRHQPWLLNIDNIFVSPQNLTVQTLNPKYDASSPEALALISFLGIQINSTVNQPSDIISLGAQLGLSDEEQRQALLEFANKKNPNKLIPTPIDDNDKTDNTDNTDITDITDKPGGSAPSDKPTSDSQTKNNKSIKRVLNDILKRTASPRTIDPSTPDSFTDEAPTDEDYYSKPPVDINKIIEKVKDQAELAINEIARLEDLKQKALDCGTYTFGWFNALLELESLNSGEKNSKNQEISISFAKVEREAGTLRTLVLKHPSRSIPQSMEDLSDIPLELSFASRTPIKVAVEVVNVKSYTLRAKLRTNAEIEGVDLASVIEAKITYRNPVFLIEELRNALIKLGQDEKFKDDFDMRANLCEKIEFVFGPPGTGKTTFVAKQILQLMMTEPDFKVLVLTPTNKSADVIVNRLIECAGSDKSYLNWLVRFGTTNDSAIEKSGVFRDKTFDIRAFPRNVTVTTIARFPYDYFLPDYETRLHLSGLKWDYIFIDEASMVPLANIIYPLYKKTPFMFIISGDPFQIEPITSVDTWKDENIYTMVGLNSFTNPTTIPHKYKVTLLTTQYRSVPVIGEIFSRFAYGGVLKHNRSKDSHRPLPIGDLFDLKPLNIIKFPVSKYESIYRPKKLLSKTPYQIYSALFAFEFVKFLASRLESVNDGEVFHLGLIAPYRAQADLIDKLMTSAVFPKSVDVQVGTIHGFQGDECDVIIALFNPPPKISRHKDMFLNKLNIVNVSISRARDHLIVLMPDDNTENVENLTLIKKVEKLCKEQLSSIEHLSPIIEELIFGSSTYIEDNSFSTSHQLVNVYGKPEKLYEVRSEDSAVDVQIHK